MNGADRATGERRRELHSSVGASADDFDTGASADDFDTGASADDSRTGVSTDRPVGS